MQNNPFRICGIGYSCHRVCAERRLGNFCFSRYGSSFRQVPHVHAERVRYPDAVAYAWLFSFCFLFILIWIAVLPLPSAAQCAGHLARTLPNTRHTLTERFCHAYRIFPKGLRNPFVTPARNLTRAFPLCAVDSRILWNQLFIMIKTC